jgi:ribonuclease HI
MIKSQIIADFIAE